MIVVEFEGQTRLIGAPAGWNQKGGVTCRQAFMSVSRRPGFQFERELAPHELERLERQWRDYQRLIAPIMKSMCEVEGCMVPAWIVHADGRIERIYTKAEREILEGYRSLVREIAIACGLEVKC